MLWDSMGSRSLSQISFHSIIYPVLDLSFLTITERIRLSIEEIATRLLLYSLPHSWSPSTLDVLMYPVVPRDPS